MLFELRCLFNKSVVLIFTFVSHTNLELNTISGHILFTIFRLFCFLRLPSLRRYLLSQVSFLKPCLRLRIFYDEVSGLWRPTGLSPTFLLKKAFDITNKSFPFSFPVPLTKMILKLCFFTSRFSGMVKGWSLGMGWSLVLVVLVLGTFSYWSDFLNVQI